jgi:antitoxin (DNA-binding transcriptional repressor) of toxin-antitoxin stability system
MPIETSDETSIGVTAFKSQCLGLIDDVAQGKTSRIVLMKHNRPVAALVRIAPDTDDDDETLGGLWGAMKGMMTVAPGVDITEPTGEVWDAEQ